MSSGSSSYVTSLDYEARKRYLGKLKPDSLPDPYSIPPGSWSDDVTKWPSVDFGDVYSYLIETTGPFTKEKLKAYKSLEAYNYFCNSYVHTVYYYESGPVFILKAKVNPSQKSADKPHESWVVVCKENGSIRTAHCTCMAGLGEVCSHVAAVLFKVEAACRLGYNRPSCTSQPCQWNQSFRTKVFPARVSNIQFVNPKHPSLAQRSTIPLEPCEPAKKKHKKQVISGPQESPLIPAEELFSSLHEVIPSACPFTTVSPPNLHQTAVPISQQETSITLSHNQTLQETSHPSTEHGASPMSTSQQTPTSGTTHNTALPPPLTGLFSKETEVLSGPSLLKKAEEVFHSLSLTKAEAECIETATKKQRGCTEWYKQRASRLTSSSFHDIYTRKKQNNPQVLVQRLLSKKDISTVPAIKWGIEHEEAARRDYTCKMTLSHQHFKCTLAGLIINPLYPFLGASPDGHTQCDCCGQGLLEIKCPFSGRHCHPQELKEKPGSFLKSNGFSRRHKYYTQVQGQLALCDKDFCDFVVWTPKGITIERITRDLPFWEKLNAKLTAFYVENMLPRLLSYHPNAVTVAAEHDKENKYCFCREGDHGDMIQCDSPSCMYVWFHFVCVGIVEPPDGSWYCSDCRSVMSN